MRDGFLQRGLARNHGLLWAFLSAAVGANVPAGGSTGSDVTVTDSGASVVLSNGIVSLHVVKTSATVTELDYGGQNLFAGGYQGGSLYWSWNMPNYQNPSGCTYTLLSDPKSDSGNRAEILLHMSWPGSTATAAMDIDIRYALLRGSHGFYAAGIVSHPASYPDNPGGEWRMASYPGAIFDWMTVDAKRSRKMCSLADWEAGVQPADAPKEVRLLTQGVNAGQYECKYSYSADLGEQNAWGWSSTTKDVGIWVTVPSHEYYNGGPKKRELMCHASPVLLNMLGGQHYGMGNDCDMPNGTAVRKVFGPFFVYVNSLASGSADPQKALYSDALAQAAAEQTAWPYRWFKDSGYAQESGRATVSGTLAIADTGAPDASPAGVWIGLAPDNGVDFQFQAMTYQFWTKTASDGTFSLPHVLPGRYALYAFGSAAGTFKRASVNVMAGQALDLGTVTWTPARTAPTVWEIGVPDRDSHEYLLGDSLYCYWRTGFVDYPALFPNGITDTVSKGDWAKVLPWALVNDSATGWAPIGPTTVDFTLANSPATGAVGRFYLALASSYGTHLQVSLNGSQIGSFVPGNPSDAVIRLGSHGAFWDTSLAFSTSLLKPGANKLVINQLKSGEEAMLEWDYLRLEAGVSGSGMGLAVNGHRLAGLRRSGSRLEGDGLHVLTLFTGEGRVLARASAGSPIDLAPFPEGSYFARCGAQTLPVNWSRR